ncbi:MAG: carbamoyltransferase HypF, partial [Candidatus Lambdaproteobacteria bacterium]|nr:carbamoyltransferase HypF [Candidatus Lambdaproteobacteria bacterium]
ALAHGLSGYVRNEPDGVVLELEGPDRELPAFMKEFHAQLPPLAQVESLEYREIPVQGERDFRIELSRRAAQRFTLISPDIALCPACERELRDPRDRRHGHAFINCTNCGPRFTVIRDIPYDRGNTTMAPFAMCPDCAREYADPRDRRFHAEPIACPRCGPRLRLIAAEGAPVAGDALLGAAELLRAGGILAVKGLGGFHLACDAQNPRAVDELRRRKHRDHKPFAMAVADVQAARRFCRVSPAEQALLTSPAHPIVLLRKHTLCPAAEGVAPGFHELGLMLPYTPLHVLLLERSGAALVLTSGNQSDEPISFLDEEALRRLSPLADAFLLHDREIHVRCDDSVARVWRGLAVPLRRSRGYVPGPITLAYSFRDPVLAVGAELKNTFCLLRGRQAFLSHHIGDLQNVETLRAFEAGIAHFQRLFQIEPRLVVHDLHPDYLSTQYALDYPRDVPRMTVQHHHAHVAACMADNGIADPVIGVAFDGTGFGTDGNLWGGEFLIADLHDFHRAAHFGYFPLPGGEQAIREPWRIAWGLLLAARGEAAYDLPLPGWAHLAAEHGPTLARMIERRVNSPLSSGVGRLFDAVSALLTGHARASYEGQAAMALEQLAAPGMHEPLPWEIGQIGDEPQLSSVALFEAVLRGLLDGTAPEVLAAQFHETLARAAAEVCMRLAARYGVRRVVLSGGVFQNMRLLERTVTALEQAELEWFTHHQVPANDGGLSLGQAVIGANRICA